MTEKLDIEAIEAREKAATPGPWHWRMAPYCTGWQSLNRDGLESEEDRRVLYVRNDGQAGMSEADAAFIAAARTDVPALVALVRELLDKLTGADEHLRSLLNKVNLVTAFHRHHQDVPKEYLDELCNRQIEVEEWRRWGDVSVIE